MSISSSICVHLTFPTSQKILPQINLTSIFLQLLIHTIVFIVNFRLNERILNTDKSRHLHLVDSHLIKGLIDEMLYTTSKHHDNDIHHLTHWIIGDFGQPESRRLLKNALEQMVSDM